jgi:hypothetical protein
MKVDLPSGATWHIEKGLTKLAHRGRLPGARVFDLIAASLGETKARGVAVTDRFVLALPASWLVNSPAVSTVLRRWALAPHLETCLALLEVLDDDGHERGTDAQRDAIALAVTSLGSEPYVIEALSKVLALLTPDRVPLMPPLARAFVLGPRECDAPNAFGRIVAWFEAAVIANRSELEAIAREQAEVPLGAGGVLDRLLWFDTDGHRHFPNVD